MAPENVLVVLLKLQMQPDVDFFEKLLKDNQVQEICKYLKTYPSLPRKVRQLLHELPNRVYWNMRTAPALTAKHKDWLKKKVTWTKEKWETVVISDEKKFWIGPKAPRVIGVI